MVLALVALLEIIIHSRIACKYLYLISKCVGGVPVRSSNQPYLIFCSQRRSHLPYLPRGRQRWVPAVAVRLHGHTGHGAQELPGEMAFVLQHQLLRALPHRVQHRTPAPAPLWGNGGWLLPGLMVPPRLTCPLTDSFVSLGSIWTVSSLRSGCGTRALATRSGRSSATWCASCSSPPSLPSRAGCAWRGLRTTSTWAAGCRRWASLPSPSPSSPSTFCGHW